MSIRETGRWNFGKRRVDMTGQVFGRLTVQRPAPSDGAGRARWMCLCECGGSAVYLRSVLIAGQANSCGCLHRETARANGTIRPSARPVGASALHEVWR